MSRYCKGTVVALRQCGGCVEVTVRGESRGVFIIDNASFGMIAANEGTDWIGRPIEYEDAHMRFLDSTEIEEAENDSLSSSTPFPHASPLIDHS
jgi:hypothetical protein